MAEFDRDSFFNKLNTELAKAVGPLAPALVKEKINQLGKEMRNFPKDMAAYLVELLSQEIGDEEREVQFQSSLLDTLINL
jgi:hypothetical protein